MTKLSELKLDEVAVLIKNSTHKSCVAYFGWVYKGGKATASGTTWCHAGLMRGDEGCLAVWSAMQNHPFNEKQETIFVDYMLKDSPWKDVFLNTDLQHVKTYGWLADTDVDAHLLVNAIVATRLISEFPERFRFFLKAMENGVEKNMAMVLSQFCADSDTSFFLAATDGHGFIYDINTKIIPTFLNKAPIVHKSRSYKTSPTYNRHCDVWDGRKADPYDSGKSLAILQKIPQYKDIKKINLNIFYSEKKKSSGYVYHSYDTLPYFVEQVKEKFSA